MTHGSRQAREWDHLKSVPFKTGSAVAAARVFKAEISTGENHRLVTTII